MTDAIESTDAAAQTGSWFPVPTEGVLPADLQKLFAKARERLGFVPNVFRVYAFRPERLSAWFAHYRQLHEPSQNLSAADREMIAVVVSAANGCLYCLIAHGAALRAELGDPVLGERVSCDWRRTGLDSRRATICAYAEKLTLRPREVTRADLQTLLDVGLTLEEAWDVAELSAMYNLTNRMAMATNMLPNEQYSGQARQSRLGTDVEARLRSLYEAFNARDIDATLAAMTDDIDWPNGWQGGREHGHAAVRDYWTRQWAEIDPRVEPLAVTTRPDGRVAVDVRQVVRNLEGGMISQGRVVHVYELRDGLVARMDIEAEPRAGA